MNALYNVNQVSLELPADFQNDFSSSVEMTHNPSWKCFGRNNKNRNIFKFKYY